MQQAIRIKSRFVRSFRPHASLESQNAWNLYAEIAWFSVLSGIASSFLSVFVIRVGGSDFHVGLLSALPAFVTFAFSMPGGRLVEREEKPLSVLLSTAVLHRLGYLAVALVPSLLANNRADAIILIVGLLTIPAAVYNVAFTTLFAKAVQPKNRALVVSIRYVWVGTITTAVALLGGKFLDLVEFPLNYQVLFTLGVVASGMSVYYLARVRVLVDSEPVIRAVSPREDKSASAEGLARGGGYRRFAIRSFIFHWGLYFTLPLYPIFWVRTLNATEGWVGLLNTVGSVLTILCYPLWGRLTARRGNAFGVFLASLGLSIYPLATLISPSVEWLVPVQILGGMTTSGYFLTFFNRLLELVPERTIPGHVARYNTFINTAAFISPVIAASLTTALDVRALLLVGGAMRFLGPLLFWREVGEKA